MTVFRTLDAPAVRRLVVALLSQLPEESNPIVTVKPERPMSGPRGASQRSSRGGPMYMPSVVFLLELATVLAMRDKETIELVGEDVTAALQTAVRDSPNLHPVVVSRAVYYLLSLLQVGFVSGVISVVRLTELITLAGIRIHACPRRASLDL